MTTTAPPATQNPWEHPLTNGHAPPLSERLIRALEAHLAAGAQDIADCHNLAQDSKHPVAQLLLGLIVEDEQRHHALLLRIVRRLQEEVEFAAWPPTTLPVPSDAPFIGDDRTVGRLRALIRDEEEGARYLRHLARQDPGLYEGLFGVLLETIARDSQKHAYVLRYLLRTVEAH
jgi:rubrerythrin